MRARKPLNGKVTGVKFKVNEENGEIDLKQEKARILKEIEENEQKTKEWYDKEMEKNLNKK
ncbi:MAG: hypothetical protein H7257_13605 [Taibaiella sp.]|nr:hypothetical protein [Taibaiella sp.]